VSRVFRCSTCAQEAPWTTPGWRCPCGGPFDLTPPRPGAGLNRAVLQLRPASLWRFREAFPFPAGWTGWRDLSLGEGGTALVVARPDRPDVTVKLELASPTLSFKDRGAVMLIARATLVGASHVVVDSSGNAGTAVAAYAARAGLPCRVFVPSTTSPTKVAQMVAHGADVVPVNGGRAAVAAAAEANAVATGAFYASHVYDPFFFEGTKTFAFEIWEQMGHQVPDVVALPVGNGTLVLGCALGFAELAAAGAISQVPRILAVQSLGCPPLALAFAEESDEPAELEASPTVAEGIAIESPPRGRQVLAAVRRTDGEIIAVSDEEILAARHELAAAGLFVEPTGAVAWAGLTRADLPAGITVVVPLCGAGIKSPG
jgi:threonine synthase